MTTVAILVGNECWGTAGAAPLPMNRHLFQDFSLPSQPRDRSRPLAEILAAEGLAKGTRVGLVGWKAYAQPWMSDVPAYLVDTIRGACGADNVVNATGLLIDAQDGLRVINEPEQIAVSRVGREPRLGRRAPAPLGTAAGHDRARGRGAAALERHAAVVPPDADRGAAREIRPAVALRPQDRARRHVHHGLWHLGRADVSRRLRGRGRQGAAAAHPRLRPQARWSLLRSRRGVARGTPCGPDRRRV